MDNSESLTVPTPLPPTVDWNEVQRRYLQGDPICEIAEDCGTKAKLISDRAWRYGWKALHHKQLEENKQEVEREVKGSIMVSVLKEARAFSREDTPSDLALRDVASKVRLRLLETASKLFGWDADPVAKAKPVKAIDV